MKVGLLLLVAAVVCAPVQARAEAYVNPWAGVIFGNNEVAAGLRGFGVAFGDSGGSLWGTESNIGLSPGIFGNGVENYVLDFMAGITVGPSFAAAVGRNVRPYGVGEFGMIRSSVDATGVAGFNFARNDLGVCVGGGVTFDLNDRMGLRGEARYYRTLGGVDAVNSLHVHLANLHYWRVSVGLILQ